MVNSARQFKMASQMSQIAGLFRLRQFDLLLEPPGELQFVVNGPEITVIEPVRVHLHQENQRVQKQEDFPYPGVILSFDEINKENKIPHFIHRRDDPASGFPFDPTSLDKNLNKESEVNRQVHDQIIQSDLENISEEQLP
ncbi:hypothetical protein WICPIJ_001024 [Wickerhamomyces pijperi]|uniref:Uncharacterized protein n=1 Tax=Wickerhamomyces pijperi TaxID=599730 RepID=A0A9P8QBI1_WICPI|nr:hypothetical protein WICPIJ_001024 [Wickerhamomyces pijperi]